MRKSFAAPSFHHRIAFSDVHIHEMWTNQEEYTNLINELDAVFVRNPGQLHNRHNQICSLDPAQPEERFATYLELSSVYDAFEAMLAPIHHFLGGFREKSMIHIAKETQDEIAEALEHLFHEHPHSDSSGLHSTLKEISMNLSSIDVTEGWRAIEDQVLAARHGDPMKEMDPIEKVKHLLSKLDETERCKFEEEYPEKFAQVRGLETGELTGFAFALFGLGLTKRKGVFSGPRQAQKFAAQFRDAQHIEEASRCDWFVTFDQGASELAASTYAYAGIGTNTILLKKKAIATSV